MPRYERTRRGALRRYWSVEGEKKREKRKKKKKKKKFKTMGIEGERRSLVKNEGMGRGRGREGVKPNEAKSFKL